MLQLTGPAFAADGQTINNTRISITADNITLKEAFTLIEQKTDFVIGYDNTVDIKKHISLHVSDQSISEVLKKLLKNYKGTISQVDDHHVVIRVEKAQLDPKSPLKTEQPPVKISGTVVDEKGLALPGVSIYEKKSHKGTATDINGKFTITVEPGTTLVFAFVGYTNQEIVVGEHTEITVKLLPSTNILNEVVAIGYQTVRKSDFTGAIASVKSEELNLTAPTVGQALVGKVAGVQVSQVSGSPYSTTKINVRGVGSFLASSDPLYVIDGYAAGNDLFINPDDIESIDVLKDAASAAIYGSRAAGGVVLITTKHGSKENSKGKFEYDVQVGVNGLAKKVDLLNSDQFAQLVIDGRNNSYHDLWVTTGHTWNDAMYSDDNATRIANVGNAGSVSVPPYLYNFQTQSLIHQTVNTDWQDELYRHPVTQSHSLSFSGNSNGTRYYFSTGYQDNPGIMLGTGQKKINLRANIDGQIGKRLKVGANIAFTQTTNQETQDGRWDHSPAFGALIYMPFFPAYNADGSIATNVAAAQSTAYAYQSIENPIATATLIKINRVGDRATYNAHANYSILDGLSFNANLGMQTYAENYNYYLPTNISNGANPPGSPQSIQAAKAIRQTIDYRDQLGEFTLNYTKQLGKNHFDGLVGYTAQKTTNNVLTVQGTGFQNDNIPNIAGANPAQITLITPNSSPIEGVQPTGDDTYTLLSYLGRINYNYDSKYFLSASFRTDGSSRFGTKTRYANFPSVSAGWNLSDESFYHGWLGDQSTVKLRASWGLSGNNNIGNYTAQQYFNPPANAVFGTPGATAPSLTAGNIADPGLTWESTSQYNFGADLGLLKGRLFIIVNYYLSHSYNLLFKEPISAISGNTTVTTNLGPDSRISNKGFDFQVDGKVIAKKDFSLNLSGNISINRNKVLNLGGSNTIISAGAERSYLTNITETGQPVGMFYGYKVAGIVSQADLANIAADRANYNPATQSYPAGYKIKGPPISTFSTTPIQAGDLYFKDVNGDGVINAKDAGIIGTPYPKFTYGFAINATFKNFYFSSAFAGSYGNQIVDGQDYYLYNMEGSGNQYADVADRYRNAADPGAGSVYRASRGSTQSNSTRLSTFYLQSGSFLRNTNMTLGYTLKSDYISRNLGLGSLKIYGAVNNGFTITKYKGYNPEVNYNYSYSGSQNTNLTPGIDYGVYPLVRSYNLGVKATF
ncbi:TonB-dependent receptor [Mucilaginibacter sp. SG564]|uniref:SusC/RagA family TonB-linked outer membrane protein n=1 Tax=Mucilaginibacter sp. SG564 TaxID=2587022 RepID=UPI0020A689E9|nr:TonB-dependent receptor [Mucilaginibacter sp. SG564]NOW93907.1 TonB-linked SusC/RagA family outer membrane protein [Mucilaginibacter sp. SG564]